ncbi:orotidine-5'-phosphate decarboxylase [Leptolyngbya sp. FACHB-261]|uniref:orotidine-5'-phosphate decarboxylase n=1 Tax=Leptolyngbya sp. FACHB-261 TaxID=2692806 RepID=UPI00168A1501|nr:orotidine-5'-phosphate decarboxylase [Leptolyngbya sp. FACHB-261]MBD2104924.1 orotidine-5'-phosphate decarboxylase [Leptolyngbya sp. FACHB-261]
MKLSPADQIIVALDVAGEPEALALVAQLPEVRFWKVGLELFISCGPGIVQKLRQQGKRIFLDLKLHDIPNTVAGAVQVAASYGVDLLTVHAVGGRAMLKAAVAAAEAGAAKGGVAPPRLLAVTLLTSLSSRDLAFDLNVPLELPEYTLKLALLAQECGIGGAVCSPQEVEELRTRLNDGFCLVTPGVRPDWSVANDQSRHTTPASALRWGSDYLVIGRPITAAPDPAAAFRRLCTELSEVGV